MGDVDKVRPVVDERVRDGCRKAPLMMRKRFRNVEQDQDMPAYENGGKQTFKLSPLIVALNNHDLNCMCVVASGDCSPEAVPAT